jgi:hypothetical protein
VRDWAGSKLEEQQGKPPAYTNTQFRHTYIAQRHSNSTYRHFVARRELIFEDFEELEGGRERRGERSQQIIAAVADVVGILNGILVLVFILLVEGRDLVEGLQ